jgi:hypothetical protein
MKALALVLLICCPAFAATPPPKYCTPFTAWKALGQATLINKGTGGAACHISCRYASL